MSFIERVIQVNYRLRVFFTEEVFAPSNELLKEVLTSENPGRRQRVLMVVDESLAAARPGLCKQIEDYFRPWPLALKLVCPPVVIEGGERSKNSDVHVTEILSLIERYGICRHSYLIALGGGALLDVAGLAAATAHRGVRHVRIPTTTLSQDDSGVGVKNGINAFGKKNFIGTFAPPYAVINDFKMLESLPPREKRAGYIEAIKVALIRDKSFFERLEQDAALVRQFDPEAMKRLIRRSAELHLDHIASGGDPFEFGSARPLDFGHWAAHKLEQLSEYSIPHGEAVAIGIALDVTYSKLMGYITAGVADRILNLIAALGFDLFANELLHADSKGTLMVLRGLEEFREHLGGELTVTMLKGIGEGFEAHQVDTERMVEAVQELKQRHGKQLRKARNNLLLASS
jgi:3-dehydroquinate synthase